MAITVNVAPMFASRVAVVQAQQRLPRHQASSDTFVGALRRFDSLTLSVPSPHVHVQRGIRQTIVHDVISGHVPQQASP